MEIKYNNFQTGFSSVDINLLNSFLKKDYTSDASLFNVLKTMVESFICQTCDRQFKVLNDDDIYFEEKLIIDGYFDIYNYPFVLKKIWLDGNLVYDPNQNIEQLKKDVDFKLSDYSIYFFMKGKFKVGYNIVKFYGDDINLAVLSALAEIFKKRDFGLIDIRNFSIGGTSFSFGSDFNILKQICQNYKKNG